MKPRGNDGQAIIELAILLPALLLLLAGTYVAARTANLASAASSAAHAEAIRSGRQLSGMERALAGTVTPDGQGVSIRAENGTSAALLPSPFPSLEGRTTGVAEVEKEWPETGDPVAFPRISMSRRQEMSVNCWDAKTSSGRKIRNTVRAFVASAVLQ